MPKKVKRGVNPAAGSLTVEAAFVLPIFIFAVSIFLYLFQFIMIQQQVQTALVRTSQYYAKNGYLLDELNNSLLEEQEELSKLSEDLGIEKYLSGQIYQMKFQRFLSKSTLPDTIILGGKKQILIQPQGDCVDGDMVDLCAYYTCRIPVLFFQVDSFDVIQRSAMRKWTGQRADKRYGEKKEEGAKEEQIQYVYITETGQRYHTHEDCTHIQLTVQSTILSQVLTLRNRSHAKYKPCEICIGNTVVADGAVVYYTNYGNRYHASGRCSGIKRTVKKVPMSEVPEGMSICQKCRKRDEKTERSD